MTKVALYARYSSDHQNAASIEDQFRICREQAERERWQIIATYKDAALSGATVTLRPGIQQLLQDALAGKFDIVLAEALDRLSRDQADVATLYKHLQFAGVKIVTLAEGTINELHVGLKGTMNALFLKDLAAKTHRGMRGRVEKGKAGGGLCYGYDVVHRVAANGEPIRGERRVNEAEAEVIRSIFRAFAAGESPRRIADRLNREGVPGPLGRSWGDTSIRGHVSRGTGILNNELYIGVIVWNRHRFIKNPVNGKRVSRINPEAAWIRTEVPELRIVDDALWLSVRQQQARLAVQYDATIQGVRNAQKLRMEKVRRPAFLLSGLLRCGCCGGQYSIVVADRYGCLNHSRRKTCDNGRTVRREVIEARALAGLKERLVSPTAVDAAVRAYTEETNRRNCDQRARAEADRQQLEAVQRSIRGILSAIEDGLYQPSMKERMAELEAQKEILQSRLSAPSETILDLPPNLSEIYRIRVERLTETLSDPDTRTEAMNGIRSLVGEIILTPGEKRGEVNAVLRGELLAILGTAGTREQPLINPDKSGPRNQIIKPLILNQDQRLFAVRTFPPKRPLRANECETPAPLKFRLEGVGNSLHGHAQ
jgi:site-specific DNA recombinase